MPGSVRENDDFVIDFVRKNRINFVLDVGAGKGTYFELLDAQVNGDIDGIEVWQPYIDQYDLHEKYDKLYVGDARSIVELIPSGKYDLIIFGDILEHMPKEDALTLWEESARVAKWGLISVPIIHYPQGAEFGNPYEVHVQDHLHPEDIRRDYGPFETEAIYEITGTFVKRF